ncbi:hypothetical protein KKG08_01035 [Patescibacteria group bacterium]|nr:hypothetical protein [Patescibacteria group bacterium]
MSDKTLDAYNIEQLSNEVLPERISSIHFDVEAIEGKRLDKNFERIETSTRNIKKHTDEKFAYIGSMGMYPLLNELKDLDEKVGDLAILEQRVSGGKNDVDVAFLPGKTRKVMLEDFGWDSEAVSKQRGELEGYDATLDIMERDELEYFPWREVTLGNETFFVQNPREAICEKINAFLTNNYDEKGKPASNEVKWGIDIKLLKTYLIASENIIPEELEERLSEDWEVYVKGKVDVYEEYYKVIKDVSELLNSENTPEEIIKGFVSDKELKVEEFLKYKYPFADEEEIKNVLESDSKESFYLSLKKILDKNKPVHRTFKEAQNLASEEYKKFLSRGT